jgi:hypothetical protein
MDVKKIAIGFLAALLSIGEFASTASAHEGGYGAPTSERRHVPRFDRGRVERRERIERRHDHGRRYDWR